MGLSWLAPCGGASVGREGPTVQVGAAVLFSIGRWIRLPHQLSEHSLIVAGVVAFNTPLAGIVFAIEEMARSFEEKTSGTLLIAVIVAGLAAMYVLGNYNYFGHTGAPLTSTAPAWRLVFVGGVLGGIAGGVFSRILLHINTLGLSGVIGRLMRSHPVGFPALCGLLLVLLGIASGNQVFGSGYPEAHHLIEAKAELPPGYEILKLLATLVSFLSGIPGGLFAPSLSVGAGLGVILAPLFPGLDASAVIVIGMVVYFAAVVQAPITAFVIVMEMIDNQDMMVPLMAAALIASTVSRPIFRTLLYKGLAMRSLLTQWGHEVIVAGSGAEMQTRIASCQTVPRLIICDYHLRAGENGIRVIQQLQSEFNADIPAMLITGDTAPERLREAQESGFLLLHKPVPNSKLRAAIGNLMARSD